MEVTTPPPGHCNRDTHITGLARIKTKANPKRTSSPVTGQQEDLQHGRWAFGSVFANNV